MSGPFLPIWSKAFRWADEPYKPKKKTPTTTTTTPPPAATGQPSPGGVSDLIATGPPQGDARSAIGVPSDFRVFVPPETTPTGGGREMVTLPGWTVGPGYFVGDEWRPGGYGPDRIAEMQSQLVDAGLLDPTDYHRGTWDGQSAAAYKEVLAAANSSGRDAVTTLALMRSSYVGKAGPKRAPLVVRYTSPDDVRAIVNNVAVNRIGRYLTNEEMDPAIGAWHAVQRQFQEQSYAAEDPAGPGGAVTQPPDLQTFGDVRVRAEHPDEVFKHTAAERFNSFMGLLSSVGGQG